MKSISTPTIVFAIFLSIWVNVTISNPHDISEHFNAFLERLDESLRTFPHVLSFTETDHLIDRLKDTSDKFKELCLNYDFQSHEEGHFDPVFALEETIYSFFYYYKESAPDHKDILRQIESTDPIGLHNYLTTYHVENSSPEFIAYVSEFRKSITVLSDFEQFLVRLNKVVKHPGAVALPFVAKDRLIEKLKGTSDGFQDLCAGYDNESKWKTGKFSPINSLQRAFGMIFYGYRQSNPSRESKRILNEIETVDPVGLNAYLLKKKESESSPTFMKSVEEFRITEYKKIPLPNGKIYSVGDFLEFTQRFKKTSENPSSSNDGLPFLLQTRLIANLWKTSDKFKLYCVDHQAKMKQKQKKFSAASPLSQAIHSIFSEYKKRMKGDEKILDEIESVDPIGLNVHLTNLNVKTSSPNFLSTIEAFYATMIDRVHLFKSGTDDSYITIFKNNPSKKLNKIPENIRKEITTEYKFLNHDTIDFFIKIAMEQFKNIKMYSVTYHHSIDKYLPHTSIKTNDVQILYSGEIGAENPGHAICIYYQASTQKVLVYDSAMNTELNPVQEEIVRKLYPHNTGIVFQTPKTIQGKSDSCAVYAIVYATTLLFGKDPNEITFKWNDNFGEDAIYLRMHILNMFANRKLILMK